jgi:hypothetical protein
LAIEGNVEAKYKWMDQIRAVWSNSMNESGGDEELFISTT